MAYDPQVHIPVDKPMGIAQAIPVDARSYFYDPAIYKYRPYQTVAEANAYLSIAKFRKGHFSLYMNLDGVLGVDGNYTGGTITEFWYRNGITNGDLVEKLPSVTTDYSKIKRYPFKIIGGPIAFLSNVEWQNATFMGGCRSGGDVFLTTDAGFASHPDAWIQDVAAGKMTPPYALTDDETVWLLFKNVNI